MECSVAQCSAVSPPRLEQLMLAKANMYRVNGFFCADRHEGSRGTVEEVFDVNEPPANLHFYKRRQKATKSAWRNALERRGEVL